MIRLLLHQFPLVRADKLKSVNLIGTLMGSPIDIDDELRRRRIRYRAGHRGIREMDLLLGTYAKECLDDLSNEELVAFENILDASDHDVLSWISGNAPTPQHYDTPVLDALKAMSLTPEDYN